LSKLALALLKYSARSISSKLFRPPVRKFDYKTCSNMSDDESDVPDAVTAQKLVKEFEHVTNTDEIIAQMYLQEHGWQLSSALNSFFEKKIENINESKAEDDRERLQQASEVQPKKSIAEGLYDGSLTTKAPGSLTMVSWNIDGLDAHNLKKRTKAVCKILELEGADIVFLQEVVPETLSYLEAKLPGYEVVCGKPGQDYFVATLLRRGRVYLDKVKVVDFPTSRMGRHLLAVQAHCGSVKFDLLNSHLESTKEHADERCRQLEQCLGLVSGRPVSNVVLFGGDLNMRDKELAGVGGLPPGTRDVWEACGSRKEVQYTWDLQRNSNLEWPGQWKPRCRFDRVYIRDSAPKSGKATYFGFLGLQKITGTQSFPSDHWGLKIHLGLEQQ